MRRCVRVTRSMRRVENELRKLPNYEGLPNLATFLNEFEGIVMDSQCLYTLDHALKATPARWWGAHKKSITNWPQCRRLMEDKFKCTHEFLNYLFPIPSSLSQLHICIPTPRCHFQCVYEMMDPFLSWALCKCCATLIEVFKRV